MATDTLVQRVLCGHSGAQRGKDCRVCPKPTARKYNERPNKHKGIFRPFYGRKGLTEKKTAT